jgi:hypothetical protein
MVFGTNQAVNSLCSDTTQCTMQTPPSNPGSVNVSWDTSPKTTGDQFTYADTTITRITPTYGSEDGGDQVEVFGSSFSDSMEVGFGTYYVGIESCTDSTHCTVFSPQGTGSVHLTIGTVGHFSAPTPADLFTFETFPWGGMIPHVGPPEGGTLVYIDGRNFSTELGHTTVTFNFDDGPRSFDVSCKSTTQCSMNTPRLTPPGSDPAVQVSITVDGRTRAIGGFTYKTPSGGGGGGNGGGGPKNCCSVCRAGGGQCTVNPNGTCSACQ